MTRFRGYGGLALLGVIQGLTEFLPVSSSGHLVVGQYILKLAEPSLVTDVVLHVGTLLPVLWLYRRDLVEMVVSLRHAGAPRRWWTEDSALRLTVAVVVGSIPTALIGGLLKDTFERLFSSTLAVGVTFLITGAILMATRFRRVTAEAAAEEAVSSDVGKDRASSAVMFSGAGSLTLLRAFIVGIAQGVAITPGISRSGSTIAAGLLLGIEREMAARLSFVMSIPAILGAVALSLPKAHFAPGQLGMLIVGALAAMASGYWALRWVVHIVRKGEIHWFSYYVWPLGIAVLVWTFFVR
ncbi:MAG: undecaprenyl-diphosphate phosphatase [Deltaproteobacteria bacterium]|nr:undecaprenyl-diphosphate phosphatase [Deltaproteobacteria bacterium]